MHVPIKRPDYYAQYGLHPKASQRSCMRKLERVIQRKIRAGEELGEVLDAFVITSNSSLRKYYLHSRKSAKRSSHLSDYIDAQCQAFRALVEQSGTEFFFEERSFLYQYAWEIVDRCLGFDFLFRGVGRKGEVGYELHNRRAGRVAHEVKLIWSYGLPVALGFLHPGLWLLLIPALWYNWHKEYWAVKHQHYFARLFKGNNYDQHSL